MRILITGGAGFIGSNLAAEVMRRGFDVTVLDNLSRAGAALNIGWLQSLGRVDFVKCDVRDFEELSRLMRSREFDAVFHQAGQVAVTTSVLDPRSDFEANALGTINLLEAIRLSRQRPVFIFASTNKVYGALSSVKVAELGDRYALPELPHGVSETTGLDFHSPYGCSKGAADQYVVDYRRIYGLRTIVFRQSCIYGPRQMGLEDQGWLAWFVIRAVQGAPITIYGDGKQVRDVLYVDDLVELYLRAVEREGTLRQSVFNVGGGPENAVSLLEVIRLLEEALGQRIQLRFADWRPGDQRVYVSDIKVAGAAFQWVPEISPREGVSRLLKWVRDHQEIFPRSRAPA